MGGKSADRYSPPPSYSLYMFCFLRVELDSDGQSVSDEVESDDREVVMEDTSSASNILQV